MESDETPSNPVEKSQSDIAAARREARRRRILENSNTRLTKITGREHNEPPLIDETVSANVIYPDPEMERDSFDPSEFQRPPGQEDVLEMLREMRSQAGFSADPQQQQQPKEPPSKLAKFLTTKIQFMLMGVAVSLLFATGNEGIIGSSVFLPLFCWEAIEVFVLKTYESKLNFLGIIFVFLGVDQQKVQIVTKLLETLNKLFKDFACFMWFFVMTHVAWGFLVQQKEWNEILYPNRETACPV